MAFLFNLFILSMYAVILSQNIITFLVFWETMSILSYFLVIFERDEKSVKASPPKEKSKMYEALKLIVKEKSVISNLKP